MNAKKERPFWYMTSAGKYVARDRFAWLDPSTKALVRDLVEIQNELESGGEPEEKAIATHLLGISETPLPFEAVHVWMTWMVRGNDASH